MFSSISANSARRRLPTLANGLAVRGVYIVVNPRKARKEKPKNKSKKGGQASYRFVDRIRIRAVGGDGGKGCLSVFRIGRKHHRRPDGGHGGRGGNVIIVADPKEQTLNWTNPHVQAESGAHGSSQEMHGRDGKNLVLRVPCGVVVRRVLNYDEVWDPVAQMVHRIKQEDPDDEQSVQYVFDMDLENKSKSFEEHGSFDDDEDNEVEYAHNTEQVNESDCDDEDLESGDTLQLNEEEKSASTDDAVASDDEMFSSSLELGPEQERESVVLGDLDTPGSYVAVARGGRGGLGSCTYGRRHGPLPEIEYLKKHARSHEGEVSFLELELKLIADVGLVGFPNAGKSSLLAAMSRAMPEIAPYPFTTLHPLVGSIEYRDGFRVLAADVPGLIGGASEGRGRGHDFLRHLERTKALLYIVDAAGTDGRDPVDDLVTLTDELSAYGEGDMLTRPALVVANKVDLLQEEEARAILVELGAAARDAGVRFSSDVLGISAGVTGVGLGPLSKAIRDVVLQSEKERSLDSEQAESC